MVVIGFISAESGLVFVHIREQNSFTKKDVADCIKLVKNKYKFQDIALFGDNARIHKNNFVEEAACEEDVELLWNIPYRPDLQGVEGLWRIAKDLYRKEIARLHVNQKFINNLEVVQWVFMQITHDQCKNEAKGGWKRLMKAVPKIYEEPPQEGF